MSQQLEVRRFPRAPRSALPTVLAGLVPMIASAAPLIWVSPAIAAAPVLKCTPPRPVNLALALDVIPGDGNNAGPGSKGRLAFTFTHLDSLGYPSPVFVGHYPAPGLATGTEQTLRLSEAQTEPCVVEESVETVDGELRLFYRAFLPEPLAPGESSRCEVIFQVDVESLYRDSIEFTARPYDCAIDPDLSDNRAVFAFGGAGMFPQPKGVPLYVNDARSVVLISVSLVLIVVIACRFGRA